jgi:hypothetical protein
MMMKPLATLIAITCLINHFSIKFPSQESFFSINLSNLQLFRVERLLHTHVHTDIESNRLNEGKLSLPTKNSLVLLSSTNYRPPPPLQSKGNPCVEQHLLLSHIFHHFPHLPQVFNISKSLNSSFSFFFTCGRILIMLSVCNYMHYRNRSFFVFTNFLKSAQERSTSLNMLFPNGKYISE